MILRAAAALLAFELSALLLPRPAAGQEGTVTGTVRDSTTRGPVGYALISVVGGEQQVFAGESGRFTLTGLPRGALTLRIQQIGYRPVRVTVTVGSGPMAPLVIDLYRQPVVLPEVLVRGDVCTGVEELAPDAAGGSILDDAFRNAERVSALERSYPFRMAYERNRTVLDSLLQRLDGGVDTVHYDSRSVGPYRKGRVLPLNMPKNSKERIRYFNISDLAQAEFRKSHCFWFAGRDSSIEGFPAYRINFATRKDVRSVDWAGSMLIDSVSSRLIRSEARLINLPSRGTVFRSLSCTAFYNPIAPTLVLEFQVACIHSHRTTPPQTVVERWIRVKTTFLGRQPVEPE